MKTTITPKEGRGWPGHILWGRVRTSTVALIIAFGGTWWLYETYQPVPPPDQVPASNVVPPGFIPDPAYTWVPRTDVQRTPEVSTTPTTTPPTTTETTTPTSPGADDTATDTPTSGEQPTPTSAAPTPSTTAAPGPSSAAPTTASAPSAAPPRPGAPAPTPAPAPSATQAPTS